MGPGCDSYATVRMAVSIQQPQSKLLKGGLYRGLYMGVKSGLIKGDTRSLDCSSHGANRM